MKKNWDIFIFDDHKIEIKFPKNFGKFSPSSYPIILVQDGSYLFKNVNCNLLFIGINPVNRNKEYTPWPSQIGYEKNYGEADIYLDWLYNKLLPYLEQKYSFDISPKNLTMSGASYGGLVSLYSLYKYPSKVDNYILLSPSLWYPNFLNFMKYNNNFHLKKRVFWYVGNKEGVKHTMIIKNIIPNTIKATKILNDKLLNDKSRFIFKTHKRGIHRHRYFKKYFKIAIKNLF